MNIFWCAISSSHRVNYGKYRLLGCDAMYSGIYLQNIGVTCFLHLQVIKVIFVLLSNSAVNLFPFATLCFQINVPNNSQIHYYTSIFLHYIYIVNTLVSCSYIRFCPCLHPDEFRGAIMKSVCLIKRHVMKT